MMVFANILLGMWQWRGTKFPPQHSDNSFIFEKLFQHVQCRNLSWDDIAYKS